MNTQFGLMAILNIIQTKNFEDVPNGFLNFSQFV